MHVGRTSHDCRLVFAKFVNFSYRLLPSIEGRLVPTWLKSYFVGLTSFQAPAGVYLNHGSCSDRIFER